VLARDSPVVDLPDATGRDDVWRDNLGRLVVGLGRTGGVVEVGANILGGVGKGGGGEDGDTMVEAIAACDGDATPPSQLK
jgi:hypothetical protein